MNGRVVTIHRRGRRASGFTLLEVLLVVGLLALLASFVIPNLVGQSDKAKRKLAEAAIGANGSIATAVKNYQVDTGRWPASLKDLTEKPSDEDLSKKWGGPYIENPDNMKDPWGYEFKYNGGEAATHNEKKYDLWSVGPDGIDGNDDDIVNWKKD